MAASVRTLFLLILASALVVPAGAALGDGVTLQILDTPDVIIANDPEEMNTSNPKPSYPFSAQVRVANGDEDRQIGFNVILYTDPAVETCDEDERAFQASLVAPNRAFAAGQTRTLGGSADANTRDADAYWPMAVSRAYYDPQAEQTVPIGGATYTLCFVALVGPSDPACDQQNRFCPIESTGWQAFVRERNQPPTISNLSVRPEAPEAGRTVLLEAQAQDADTKPREDDLAYSWTVDGQAFTGPVVQATLHRVGQHTIELSVTDGFDTVTRTTNVTVQAGNGADDPSNPSTVPAPGALALVIVVSSVVLARPYRRVR